MPNEAGSQPGEGAPSRRCPAPCVVDSFETLGNAQDLSPADPTGAGGDTHVVVAVNSAVAVYSRAGASEAGPFALNGLFTGGLPFAFDPRIVYDQYRDTYVLTFLGIDDPYTPSTSRIYMVAIPDATASTPTTWCGSVIDGDQRPGNGTELADYPGLGHDQDRVYVSTNQFPVNGGYAGTQIVAFDKDALYDCLQPLAFDVFTTADTKLPAGRKSQSLAPATTVGAVVQPEYLFGFDARCTARRPCWGRRIVIFRITDTGGGLELAKGTRRVTRARMTIGTQKGAPLRDPDAYWETGDLRFSNAFYDADTDRLYAAHAIAKDLKPKDHYLEAVARWYEVDPAPTLGSSSVTRKGIVGVPRKDLGWPVVATDSLNNLFLNVSRGSGAKKAKEYIGAWITTVPPGTTSADPMVAFAAGEALYDYFSTTEERWGDFAAANRDPLDGAELWVINQFAESGGDFRQVVARVVDL